MEYLGKNMFIVYILKSLSCEKYYVGYTSDLEKRIQDHNSGLSKFTSRYCPWRLIYKEEYSTRSEAIKREKYFKSSNQRIQMKHSAENECPGIQLVKSLTEDKLNGTVTLDKTNGTKWSNLVFGTERLCRLVNPFAVRRIFLYPKIN